MLVSEPKRIAATVASAVEKLANGEFQKLLDAARTSRLSAIELKTAIAEYGIDIAELPVGDNRLDVVEIKVGQRQSWSVWCFLIDRNHGPTDLQLRLTVIENQKPLMEFEIDDILVP